MRKMVMLSLDAFFDRDLSLLTPGGFLEGWLKRSACCTSVKTVFPALTYPAHTTLITGCDPARHGVGQNQPFAPDTPAENRAWYWDASCIKAETLFDAVKRGGGKCASMLWPVTGKNPSIRWNFPEVLALPGENQVLKMLRYGTAPWILHMELKHGRDRVSTHEPHLSDYAVTLVEDVLAAHQPDLTAAHLVDLDEMRHHHGVESPEAVAAIHRLEARVERVDAAMRRIPGMRDAYLVLVSDHGQADVSVTVNLEETLEKAGLGGQFRVQSNGMSAYLFPSSDRSDVDAASVYFSVFGEKLGVSRVYDRAALDAMGCVAGPALSVEAGPDVVFEDGLPQAKREKATHGFGPGSPAENCLLAVRGPDIREGARLPSMPMRDVAPTLADLMGVSLPGCQGTSHINEMR